MDVQTYNIIADNWNYAIQPPAPDATYFLSGTLQVEATHGLSDRINQQGIFNQAARYAGTRKTIMLSLPSTTSVMLIIN